MRFSSFILFIFIIAILPHNLSAGNPDVLYLGDSPDGSVIPLLAGYSQDTAVSLLDTDLQSSTWYLRIDGIATDPVEEGWNFTRRNTESSVTYSLSNRLFDFSREIVVSGDGSHCRINATFTNNSSETISVEPLLLLDTWLGEDNGLPFLLSDGSYPRAETFFPDSDIPSWIKTVRNSSSPDLTIIFEGNLPTRPETVSLANWLRIRESIDSFEATEGRNFDYLPFSENDSAVLIKYKEKNVSAGDSMIFTVVLGLNEGTPEPREFETIVRTAVDADFENRRLREYTLRQRLREISAILDEIDDILDTNSDPGTDKIVEMESRTAGQEKLKTEYENL